MAASSKRHADVLKDAPRPGYCGLKRVRIPLFMFCYKLAITVNVAPEINVFILLYYELHVAVVGLERENLSLTPVVSDCGKLM